MKTLTRTLLSLILLASLLAAPLSALADPSLIGVWSLESIISGGTEIPVRLLGDEYWMTLELNSDGTGLLSASAGLMETGEEDSGVIEWKLERNELYITDSEGTANMTYIDGRIYWSLADMTFVFCRGVLDY